MATKRNRKARKPESPQKQQPEALPVSPASFSFGKYILTTLALMLVSLATHIPFLHKVQVEDDIVYLRNIGSVQQGVSSLSEFVWSGANEHFSPLWKFWYYVMWQVFGLEPFGWHLVIIAAHGVSAALLFFLLRNYLSSTPAAFSGAFVWAAAAISGWDNPLLFVAASHLVFGFLGLLAAMCCVTKFHGSNSSRWAAGMLACLVAATLNMGAMLVLAPILLVQYVLLEHRSPLERKRLLTWGIAWSAPILVLGIVQALSISSKLSPMSGESGSPDVVQGVVRTSAEFQTTLAAIVLRPVDAESTMAILPAAAIGAIVIAGLFLIPGINRRVLIVFFGLSVVYTILVHTMRSGYSDEQALTWGRYAYVPAFAWCTAIAAIAALPQFNRTVFAQRCLTAVLILGVSFYTLRQFEFTQSAVHAYDRLFSDHTANWEADRRIMQQLAEQAVSDKRAVLLTNFPLLVPPPITVLQLNGSTGLAGKKNLIEIVSPVRPSEQEFKNAASILATLNDNRANEWQSALNRTVQLSDFLINLSNLAEEQNETAILPNFAVPLNNDRIDIKTISKHLFYDGSPGVKFLDGREVTLNEAMTCLEQVAAVPGEVAREFEEMINQLIGHMQPAEPQ